MSNLPLALKISKYSSFYVIGKFDDRVSRVLTKDGRTWSCKSVNAHQILGEALGYLFSDVMDITAPRPGAVVVDAGMFWLSELIPNCSHCDPSRGDELEDLSGLGRLLALDLLICNHDRHQKNLLIDYEAPPNCLAIDFEKCHLWTPGMMEIDEYMEPGESYCVLEWEVILRHAREFSQGLVSVVDQHVDTVLQECYNLVNFSLPKTQIREIIRLRADHVSNLLDQFEVQARARGIR